MPGVYDTRHFTTTRQKKIRPDQTPPLQLPSGPKPHSSIHPSIIFPPLLLPPSPPPTLSSPLQPPILFFLSPPSPPLFFSCSPVKGLKYPYPSPAQPSPAKPSAILNSSVFSTFEACGCVGVIHTEEKEEGRGWERRKGEGRKGGRGRVGREEEGAMAKTLIDDEALAD